MCVGEDRNAISFWEPLLPGVFLIVSIIQSNVYIDISQSDLIFIFRLKRSIEIHVSGKIQGWQIYLILKPGISKNRRLRFSPPLWWPLEQSPPFIRPLADIKFDIAVIGGLKCNNLWMLKKVFKYATTKLSLCAFQICGWQSPALVHFTAAESPV